MTQLSLLPVPDERDLQPTEVLPELRYRVNSLFGAGIELDFSWADDAITMCDMRVPSALRYRTLYTRQDIQKSLGQFPDLKERLQKFMGE